jgi:hypothetical protein
MGRGAHNGRIFSNFAATLSVTDCTLTNNAARFFGGGIDNDGGTATVTNCTLAENAKSAASTCVGAPNFRRRRFGARLKGINLPERHFREGQATG